MCEVISDPDRKEYICGCSFRHVLIGSTAIGTIISIFLFCINLIAIAKRKSIFPDDTVTSAFELICIFNLILILLKLWCDVIILLELLKRNRISYFFWFINDFYNVWLLFLLIICVWLPFNIALFYGIGIGCIFVFFTIVRVSFYKIYQTLRLGLSSEHLNSNIDTENYI